FSTGACARSRHSSSSPAPASAPSPTPVNSVIYYQQETAPDLNTLFGRLVSSATNQGGCSGVCTNFYIGDEDSSGHDLVPSPIPSILLPPSDLSQAGLGTQGYGFYNAGVTLGVQTDFNGSYGIVINPAAIPGGMHAWVIPQVALGVRMVYQDGSS